jgi:hypothetical protein
VRKGWDGNLLCAGVREAMDGLIPALSHQATSPVLSREVVNGSRGGYHPTVSSLWCCDDVITFGRIHKVIACSNYGVMGQLTASGIGQPTLRLLLMLIWDRQLVCSRNSKQADTRCPALVVSVKVVENTGDHQQGGVVVVTHS